MQHILADTVGDPRYVVGALICLAAIAVLGIAASRPLPPPGTPWPQRRVGRRRAMRAGRWEDPGAPFEVIHGDLLREPEMDDDERRQAWELSKRRHPSYPRRDIVRRD